VPQTIISSPFFLRPAMFDRIPTEDLSALDAVGALLVWCENIARHATPQQLEIADRAVAEAWTER
jgi:hypothetical protein